MPHKVFQPRFLSALALVGSVTLATTALAQSLQVGGSAKAGSTGSSATATSKAENGKRPVSTAGQKPTATETPRDPKGITGISPFWESINKGDAAFLAQDMEGASVHYQAAIQAEPKNSIGHLRMAELSLKKDEVDRAEEFVTAALRFSADVRTKAHASFLMAEVKERRAAHEEALTAWRTYKAIDGELPKDAKAPARGPLPPVVYVETADQRTAAIEAKKKLDEEYAAVRERIQANIDRADEATGGKKAEEKPEEKK